MFVSLSLIIATLLTDQVPVFHAIMDTDSTMESVSSLPLKSLLTKDAEHGTGKIRDVLLAPTTGSSTTLVFVSQFLTNAKLLISQVLVCLAMMATDLTTESANLLPLKNLQTLDVELGIGKTRDVWPVQTTGSSTIWEFASLSLISAKHSTHQELASHAMMVTDSTTEPVSSPPLKNPPMKDAELGTGKIEDVLLAPTTGSSTTWEFASLSLISAKPSTHQELAFLVTKDTT